MRISLANAEKTLGLTPPYDDAAVRAAFAEKLKAAHPDSGVAVDDVAGFIGALKEARDKLVAELAAGGGGELETCSRCRGKGWRPASGFGRETCRACGGDGLKRRTR